MASSVVTRARAARAVAGRKATADGAANDGCGEAWRRGRGAGRGSKVGEALKGRADEKECDKERCAIGGDAGGRVGEAGGRRCMEAAAEPWLEDHTGATGCGEAAA